MAQTTWEYTAISVGLRQQALVDDLNRLGAEGWELVFVVGDRAILKRPTPDLRDIVTEEQRARALREPES